MCAHIQSNRRNEKKRAWLNASTAYANLIQKLHFPFHFVSSCFCFFHLLCLAANFGLLSVSFSSSTSFTKRPPLKPFLLCAIQMTVANLKVILYSKLLHSYFLCEIVWCWLLCCSFRLIWTPYLLLLAHKYSLQMVNNGGWKRDPARFQRCSALNLCEIRKYSWERESAKVWTRAKEWTESPIHRIVINC